MAANEYLPFATDPGANVMTYGDYNALGARLSGFSSGVAIAQELNTVWRQASVGVAALAKLVVDRTGADMLDDGSVANFESKLAVLLDTQIGHRRLAADLVMYVSSTGNDANDGLSAPNAKATVTATWNYIADNLDLNGHAVTIQIVDGAYTEAAVLARRIQGQTGPGGVVIQGNLSSMTAVGRNVASAPAFSVINGCMVTLRYMKLTATGSISAGSGIAVEGGGIVYFDHIEFGACSFCHLNAVGNSSIYALGPYTISGGGFCHATSYGAAFIRATGQTITLTGTPAFSAAFAISTFSYLDFSGVTFAGAATGVRYISDQNAVVYTAGGGATFLPGNAGGSATNGGVYV